MRWFEKDSQSVLPLNNPAGLASITGSITSEHVGLHPRFPEDNACLILVDKRIKKLALWSTNNLPPEVDQQQY